MKIMSYKGRYSSAIEVTQSLSDPAPGLNGKLVPFFDRASGIADGTLSLVSLNEGPSEFVLQWVQIANFRQAKSRQQGREVLPVNIFGLDPVYQTLQDKSIFGPVRRLVERAPEHYLGLSMGDFIAKGIDKDQQRFDEIISGSEINNLLSRDPSLIENLVLDRLTPGGHLRITWLYSVTFDKIKPYLDGLLEQGLISDYSDPKSESYLFEIRRSEI